MSKPSKQLSAMLDGTPRTTAAPAVPVRAPVSYAAKTNPMPSVSASLDNEQDTMLQVSVPLRVRVQLDMRHATQRKSLRTQVLEGFRAIGIVITDEDLVDRRKGRPKSVKS